MPKIAINQTDDIVFMPQTYIGYKMVIDVTDQQLLLILDLGAEDLKILTDQLLLSLTQIDEHKGDT